MQTNTYFFTGTDMIGRAIAPFTFDMFLSYMPIILDLARGMSDIQGRETDRRGYLTLMDGITGKIIFTVPFGEIPEEKRELYFKFSQEKAKRLFSQLNMHLPDGHTSSFESRDQSIDRYGGAIYFNYHSSVIILSFSGMPELIDEAMMLVLGKKLSIEIGKPILTKIEAFERNQYFKDLYLKITKQMNLLAGRS